MDKQEIRKNMLEKRRQLEKEFMDQAEEKICKKLFSLELYQNAETVMFYMNHRHEVSTEKLLVNLLMHEKNFVLPFTDDHFKIIPFQVPTHAEENFLNNLKLSRLGILEPNPDLCPLADLDTIDLVIVPGVAFNTDGGRIGFGKGCYDRFLPLLSSAIPKIALAYEFQITRELCSTPDDIPMNYIITEERIIKLN